MSKYRIVQTAPSDGTENRYRFLIQKRWESGPIGRFFGRNGGWEAIEQEDKWHSNLEDAARALKRLQEYELQKERERAFEPKVVDEVTISYLDLEKMLPPLPAAQVPTLLEPGEPLKGEYEFVVSVQPYGGRQFTHTDAGDFGFALKTSLDILRTDWQARGKDFRVTITYNGNV